MKHISKELNNVEQHLSNIVYTLNNYLDNFCGPLKIVLNTLQF